ncbi:MAG TPA: 50S ribosomal protein L19 [Spirochaetota bacterium]|nr:50S ribosomal protein L19 [Spirochaetota bacterium]
MDKIKEEFLNRNKSFTVGDLVKVNVRIVEGKRERIQVFEGYVISIKGSGITRSVKVRKNSFGVGVERTFPLFSPKVESFNLVRRGKIRRAKLYYLRKRTGKKAQIREDINFKTAE